jgi:phosphohistidine phosphatase
MKNLLIMRHAKSAYPPDVTDDFDRPLNGRGQKDAPRVARLLGAFGPTPERIVSSPALRARETAEMVAAGLEMSAELLSLDERLYLASTDVLNQVAGELPDALSSVLIVAHNPGMEQWIGRLCGGNVRMPTAGLAAVELPISRWIDVERVRGQLQWLVIPRLIKAIT